MFPPARRRRSLALAMIKKTMQQNCKIAFHRPLSCGMAAATNLLLAISQGDNAVKPNLVGFWPEDFLY